MGPQHGRILQAYFDGSELVIYKSKLYDFKNEETAPVKLFLQYSHEHTIWGNHIFADPFTEGVTVAQDTCLGEKVSGLGGPEPFLFVPVGQGNKILPIKIDTFQVLFK